MKRNLTALNNQAFVPLRDAVLCLDCWFVSSSSEGTCCVCHSTTLLSLAEIVTAVFYGKSAWLGSG